MKKIGLVSLGCAKNLVDSEEILGALNKSHAVIVSDPQEADAIIVNTCGFIDSSKQESINTILEMAQYHKVLIVVGCLVERYYDELKKELPEVDLFVPLREYKNLHLYLNELLGEEEAEPLCPLHRVLSTPSFTAYLRISDGCDNCCTYCAIPLIRGRFKSRPLEELVAEAQIIAAKGVKELVVISQDTTKYGIDLENTSIVTLLQRLLTINQFAYIRLLYLYPDEISDDLLDLIAHEKRLTPYFDLPIQHASSSLLQAMNRRGDRDFLLNLMKKIREKVPHAILRTTLIVGFPNESEDDFTALLDFMELVRFDHLGAFTYSREEGTKAYDMDGQIAEDIKNDRLKRLMTLQRKISFQQNKRHVDEIMEGIVVNYNQRKNNYELRSGWNAPDDIDGKIIFTSPRTLKIGQIIKVKITAAFVYDLYGEEVL